MSFRILSLIFLSCAFVGYLEASHDKKLPAAAIVGTVYCDTCFRDAFSRPGHFISGATVAVECGHSMFRKEAKTDKKGEFHVHLPIAVTKHAKKIKACSVKVIKSSDPNCAEASATTSSSNSIQLKSRSDQGTHIFSAGFFTFKPRKQPTSCNFQKPNVQNSDNDFGSTKTNTISTYPALHGLPQLPPLPALPGLPSLPGLPGLPPFPKNSTDGKDLKSFFFPPPIFSSPPPTFGGIPLPPNPLQPPALLPPVPFQPQPPPFFNLPPIPILTPSPPPPAFPFPFPGFPPFPGVPPVSGVPRASSSSTQKTSPP